MLAPATHTRKRNITSAQAAVELAQRELAKRDLIDFSMYVDPNYVRYAAHALLGEKLMQVERFVETQGREGISRLIIEMPPQHGKSELASIKFPAWVLGRLPDAKIILTSYGADLATKNSKEARDLVNSARFQAVFGLKSSTQEPVLLSADDKSSSNWGLAQPHGGGVLAAGVGGAITGFGAWLLIIDDPLKNREEAESLNRRELIWDWYRSSARTRLRSWGAVVIFHTRWHQDDLAGRLIKQMMSEPGADKWEIVCLPAMAYDDYPDEAKQREMMLDGVFMPLADPLGRRAGEALVPEMYGREWLESTKVNSGAYDFEAMYQQIPYLRTGGFFQRKWFEIVDQVPEGHMRWIRYWDKAATSGGGDYTAGVLMGKHQNGNYYIGDICRGQWSTGKREEMIQKTGQEDNEKYGQVVVWHQQEPASAGKDSALATNAAAAEAGLMARFEPVSGEKEVRAGPLSAAAEGGKVFLVRGSWNDPFLSEATAFPKGRNDDQVDAAASAYNKLRGKGKVRLQ